MTIGLTGTIASGKSTVSRRLSALGATVLDADIFARAAVDKGSRALSRIVSEFGSDMLNSDGTLNRKRLATAVFADADARMRLNAIIHPEVLDMLLSGTREALKRDARAVVIWDVPLLIECGWQKHCDAVWLVTASEETRIARVMARDSSTREEAARRISAQLPDGEKAKAATEILTNDGTEAELTAKIDALYAKYERAN